MYNSVNPNCKTDKPISTRKWAGAHGNVSSSEGIWLLTLIIWQPWMSKYVSKPYSLGRMTAHQMNHSWGIQSVMDQSYDWQTYLQTSAAIPRALPPVMFCWMRNVSCHFAKKVKLLGGSWLALSVGKQLLGNMRDVLEVPAGGREGKSSLLPCLLRHLSWAGLIGSGRVKVHTLGDRVGTGKSYLWAATQSHSLFIILYILYFT